MSDNIRVGIRLRPKISNDADNKQLWQVKDGRCIYQVSSPSNKFCFDRVFSKDEDNLVVYNDLCLPIVDSVMQGFNGTIFAYGQTASGKTYTMMGEHNGITQGILHYTITDIFNSIQDSPEREFLLRVTFLEIYNEKVYDLLSDRNEDLSLRKDTYGNIYFLYCSTNTSLEEKIVKDPNQILTLMHRGLKKRHTGDTEMNQRSSRSHCIFRMIIESRLRGEEDAVVNVSQLNLVDLAGSENVGQTKATCDRFKEGIHINLSLSTLSRVIYRLSEKDNKHINYRDSKLTRILQNSLGGNSLTAIICTVTPTSKENISTLNFAVRAKKIKNKPEKNEIFTDQALLRKYEHKIKELSAKLEASKEQGKELEEKTKQNENLKKEIEALKLKIVPISQNKTIRRETWGGHLDARHLQKTFAVSKNPLTLLSNLCTLEEETEGDIEITNLDFDLTSKRKKSSTTSISTLLSCSSPKNFSNVETQTEIDANSSLVNNFGGAYEDVIDISNVLPNGA